MCCPHGSSDLCPLPRSFKACHLSSPVPALAQETWTLSSLGPPRTQHCHHLGQLVAGGRSQLESKPNLLGWARGSGLGIGGVSGWGMGVPAVVLSPQALSTGTPLQGEAPCLLEVS